MKEDNPMGGAGAAALHLSGFPIRAALAAVEHLVRKVKVSLAKARIFRDSLIAGPEGLLHPHE
jgi:hypothetical protein